MGDRALIIITDKDQNSFSPVIYTHYGGHKTPAIIEKLKDYMSCRSNDATYAAARMVGIIHSTTPGNLGLGMWNASEDLIRALKDEDIDFLNDYSHGDAGIVLVNCNDFSWKAFAGYLKRDQS